MILLLNENFELFEELLAVSMQAWDTLMRLHPNHSFNLYWKKQVLAFELLALTFAQKNKFKTGLKAIYEAQTIVSELDETIERNMDYIMAVNTLTGFLLLSINKPQEALEFILIAERIVYKLVNMQKAQKLMRSLAGKKTTSSLGVIGGEQNLDDCPRTGSGGLITVERLNAGDTSETSNANGPAMLRASLARRSNQWQIVTTGWLCLTRIRQRGSKTS